jgi:two-component system, response regulator AauR
VVVGGGEGGALPSRVLIIEDQEEVRQVWLEALELAGFTVMGLASADEALRRMGELRPDLIILDVILPGLDGLEFLARLRKIPDGAAMPVLVVSGYGRHLFAGPVPELRIVDTLTKPVQPSEIIDAVRRALGPG